MRRFIALLFPLGIYGILCPQGYIEDGAGNCQLPRQGANTQYAAQAFCAKSNAYLPTIRNAMENSALAGYSDNIWIGLTCTNSSKNSCTWATGLQVTDSVYTNFAPGHPNATIGGCVYFNPVNYRWFSSSCNSPFVYYCRYTPGINVPTCSGMTNYDVWGMTSPMYYFEGNCYWNIPSVASYDQARSSCEQHNAELISIHNEAENSLVQSIGGLSYFGTDAVLLGMTDNSWDDNSTVDYVNFAVNSSNFGSCVFMILATGYVKPTAVTPGKWVNGNCRTQSIAICKRAIPQIATTCDGQPNYLSGHGQIYSPILGTTPIICQYVISQPPGAGVILRVPVGNGNFRMYNDVLAKYIIPSTIAAPMIMPYSTYYSAGSVLYIYFTWDGKSNTTAQWTAEYDVRKGVENDCGGVFNDPGLVPGPFFAQNCVYKILIDKWACMNFATNPGSYSIRLGDSVSIYEDSISPENQIGFYSTITSNFVDGMVLCSQNGALYLVTNGTSGQNYPMFTMKISANMMELLTNTVHYPLVTNATKVQSPYTLTYSNNNTGNNPYGAYSVTGSGGGLTQQIEFTSMNVPPEKAAIFLFSGEANSSLVIAYGISNSFEKRTFYTTSYTTTIFTNAFASISYVAKFGVAPT